jgi:transcriptional regulator with XRE-family HTH domain
MLSDTLTSGLESYRIGPKIRALRLAKKLRLAQLGEHTGLSPGMLSKIERGQLFPTLPTLLKIAMVFGVGLEHFFTDLVERPTVAVVRKKERVRLPDRLDDRPPSYFFSSLDFPAPDRSMDAYYAEFEAPPTEPHSHIGAEIVYVVNGKLAVHVDSQDIVLSEGDSLYFDSSCPHTYQRRGRATCSAVVVVAPAQPSRAGG